MIRPPQRAVTRFFIPLIDVLILLFGIFLAVMNLIVDLLYGVVDPRIRYA